MFYHKQNPNITPFAVANSHYLSLINADCGLNKVITHNDSQLNQLDLYLSFDKGH